ncbi:unnamed protein product [Calypogeia fissa]
MGEGELQKHGTGRVKSTPIPYRVGTVQSSEWTGECFAAIAGAEGSAVDVPPDPNQIGSRLSFQSQLKV